MSLEAAAGKNPVSHVGKIYNVIAQDIAQTVVAELHRISTAECWIVSRIGSPVTEPSVVQVRLATRDGEPADGLRRSIEDIVASSLRSIPTRVEDFLDGKIDVF
jgi:S-adenosylmethionine synthetase